MKTLLSIIGLMTITMLPTHPSIYDIEINDAMGEALDLRQYIGKKLIIVNVASECGYTPQYEQLQYLHETYGDKVTILGVPCNDFGGQEPGTEAEIVSFCQKNYGVTFTITEKVSIKGDTHPLYQWLTREELNGVGSHEVRWNFHKFLINADGILHAALPSNVDPIDPKITRWIER